MEAGEENGGNASLKRQRAPLSDSEDNVPSSSGLSDGQKRRRLEAAGRENQSPKPSHSGRLAALGIKPDTPIVPSVISRVQQFTQRREGTPQSQGFKQQLLGEGEFSQRVERFKVVQASPSPSPAKVCPRIRSNFVSDIHHKLHSDAIPSSKEASRIGQEREQELHQLPFQPISENAWLKRSSSDPSLTQQGMTPPGPSSPSWVPRSRMRVRWPPMQPSDDEDKEMKDGSFTEAPSSRADNLPINTTGKMAHCDSEAPPAPVAGQLQTECKEKNAQQCEDLKEERDHKALIENEEEQLGSEEAQAVLTLSFSEDQKESNNEERLQQLTPADESNETETGGFSTVLEQSSPESIVFEEEEPMDDSSIFNDEEIEPSTDEEFKFWKYPQAKVCKEEEEALLAEEMQEELCALEEEGEMKSSVKEEEKAADVASNDDKCLGEVSSEITSTSGFQEDEKPRAEENQSILNRDQVNTESFEPHTEEETSGDPDHFTTLQDEKDAAEDACQETKDIRTVDDEVEPIDLVSNSKVEHIVSCPAVDVAEAVGIGLQRNIEDLAQPKAEEPLDVDANDTALALTQDKVSECVTTEKMEHESMDERKGCLQGQSDETHKAEEGGEGRKKVTFILEPELINDSALSQTSTSVEHMAETSFSDAELSSHDESNNAEAIDRMFEEVLEYAERMEEERGRDEDGDSGIGVCSGDKDKMDTESEKEKSEEEGEAKEECDESKKLESNGDDLLTFPPSGILSPLSKSVEAVVTPLRLAASQELDPPSLLLTPGETSTPPAESAPMYSIDAYRTQRQSKLPTIQSVTPGPQRRAPEKSQPQSSVNTKERITALNEEAGKLQTVISQTLQALSCCTDAEHGRGSLEEAEAEKLLLVSCEKRSALQAEVSRLRAERNSETGESAKDDGEHVSQQPCRGTVGITNIQLPLKVEFVCSSHSRTGRPSHYFFILIRYGPCNIIATPLATAADAQNGDTISFPTSVTLKDIRSTFEIDVEVYSLSHTSSVHCSMDRATTKSRVTPRKLLNTITRSSHTLTAAALPALNPQRSSNFCLVGSHKLSLTSLGHSKFPLDKMKLEGKIRRLLGDEFQEKVPFLSPLEGNIYLRLDSQSHSNVQHQGFLTMFELISGYGVWHRRYFVLEGCSMFYWNHPNDKETKEAEGCFNLSSSPSQCVRPVKRDSCARPFTFELVSNIPHQQQDDSQQAKAKCWFSADTKEERLDWMEKLSQALLDFHTWNRTSAAKTESQQSNTSSGNLRESIL